MTAGHLNVELQKVVLDSRKALETYQGEDYFRSDEFIVPSGYNAVVELWGHYEYLKRMTFSAVMLPPKTHLEECFGRRLVGKLYRRYTCCRGLGREDEQNGKKVGGGGSEYNDFKASILRLGNDHVNRRFVEFDYIERPGRYFFQRNRCENDPFTDCERITVIAVTLVKVDKFHQLELPCCCK